MIEYTINLMNDENKQFITSYKTKLVPVTGDIISLSDTEVFTVRQRLLPAGDNNVVLLFGKIN